MANKGEEFRKRIAGFANRSWSIAKTFTRWLRRITLDDDPVRQRSLELLFLAVFWLVLGATIYCVWLAISNKWDPVQNFDWWAKTAAGTWPEHRQSRAEIIRNMLFAAAGLTGAIFGTFQLFNSARRTRTGAIQAKTGLEAERNERFVRAAELLKDDDASVRMAGVYALERLATEEGANYTKIVINALAGFVRERTNRDDYPPRPKREYLPVLWPESVTDNRTSDERACHGTGGWGAPTEPIKAAVEALSNICKREVDGKRPAPSVDLRGAQLPRLEAGGFVMRRWRMQDANLQGARLDSAKLQGAWIWRANLHGAVLMEANLQGAWLQSADLQGAGLHSAKLQGARLDSAKLQGAWLLYANLQGAGLMRAVLQGAVLREANLHGAVLMEANLQGAVLREANLQGAVLMEANLQGAVLREANLQGAVLAIAQDLTLDQLDVAFWPSAKGPANLPDYIDTKEFEKIDKRWCTDDKDPTKLHPDLLDDDGNFKGVPYDDFRERREKELGIGPTDDEEE